MGEKGWDFIRRAPPGKNHLAEKRVPGRHNPDLRSNRKKIVAENFRGRDVSIKTGIRIGTKA